MKYKSDILLVIVALANLLALLLPVFTFSSAPILVLVAEGLIAIFLTCTNYQCVAHNFIHTPFFKNRWANQIFSTLNTLCIGVPQSLYRMHHLNHHRFNNAANDLSSFYRYAKKGSSQESLLSYAFVSPIRSDIKVYFDQAKEAGSFVQAWIEMAAILIFWAGLFYLSGKAFFIVYLPLWYLGQVAAYAENYLEHNHAKPGNRLTDSVSCYNRLYNFIWFNNGYHQEHHFHPQVHWTQMHAQRKHMLPDSERRVVSGAHWFNI